jgi:hypothetical protein
MGILVINILVLGWLTGPSEATPTAHLILDAGPGSFIGPGSGHFDIIYTPLNSDFFSAEIRRTIGTSPAQPAELLFIMGTVTSGADNTFAMLFFGTDQLGIPIQPGFYPNAQRADFAAPGHPGLDISFQNHGSNGVSGEFSIDEVTFSPDLSTILTFSARFQQFTEHVYTGTFTYSADSATVVPEPATMFLLITGISIFLLIRKTEGSPKSPGNGAR